MCMPGFTAEASISSTRSCRLSIDRGGRVDRPGGSVRPAGGPIVVCDGLPVHWTVCLVPDPESGGCLDWHTFYACLPGHLPLL